jgi:YidC/Oxa1 family membrane protein insertase
MKNNQNVIVAIVLSFLVILGWQYFIIAPKLEAERQRQIAEQQARTTDAAPAAAAGTPVPAPQGASPAAPGASPAPPGAAPAVPAGTPGLAVLPRDAALAGAQRVTIDTPSLKGSINLPAAASTTSSWLTTM